MKLFGGFFAYKDFKLLTHLEEERVMEFLIPKVTEEYEDRFWTFSVFPSLKVSDFVEPYNASLLIHLLVDSSDEVKLIAKEAQYDICFSRPQLSTSTKRFKYLVSSVMSGITCSFHSPGN